MRGVDTNLLVRFLTRDDPLQAPMVVAVFERAEREEEQLHISTTVLCELVWTLARGPFRWRRDQLSEAVQHLLETDLFVLQDADLVRRALVDYRGGQADFADYLIGYQNRTAGCIDTLTFDGMLEGSDLFSVLHPPPDLVSGAR